MQALIKISLPYPATYGAVSRQSSSQNLSGDANKRISAKRRWKARVKLDAQFHRTLYQPNGRLLELFGTVLDREYSDVENGQNQWIVLLNEHRDSMLSL